MVIMSDFAGMTDREILIAVALRQEMLANDFMKFNDTQSICNVGIDDRVRELEINGSKVSKDLALSIVVVGNRLDKVEDFVESHKGEDKKSEKTWQDWAVIAALLAALGAIAALWVKP